MTAYLRQGDRIMLAAPDFHPGNSAEDDCQWWNSVYSRQGVTVVNVAVHANLTSPVVVAVFREDDNPAEGDPA